MDRNIARCSLLLIAGIIAIWTIGGCNHTDIKSCDKDIEQKIGQMIMVGFRGMDVDANDNIAKDISRYNLGGVILFDYDVPTKTAVRNIQSAEQVRKLTSSLQKLADGRLLIAIDQEGGRVCRLKEKYGFEPTVSHKELGEKNDLERTTEFSEKTANTLSELGINMNMAPVVDLAINPDNPVIAKLGRSFSADPEIVTANAKAFIEGHRRNGVLCCIKHFPGHGSSKADSHLGLTDITNTWQAIELEPYKKLIASDSVDTVMTGHLFNGKLDDKYPATMSEKILKGILREKLGYDGVIVSDDMQMGAIRKEYGLKEAVERAVLADVDILLFANNSEYDPEITGKAVNIVKNMLKNGVISKERIEKSYIRIQKLKAEIFQ